MRFSSDWFYHNMVESDPSVKYRSILDLDRPMMWIDTKTHPLPLPRGGESDYHLPKEDASSKSISSPLPWGGEGGGSFPWGGEGGGLRAGGGLYGYSNTSEAELTLLSLRAYFEIIGKERILSERLDVGIISPYRAQVQLLRRLVKKNEFFKPFRSLITVNTVDGFQGQERDIIVISLVRSNDEGQIGFLRDLRRMNVAITRARMKLIILGDRSTLCRHPFYRKLWEYIKNL